MLRWPRIEFFRSFKQKRLGSIKKLFMPFEEFWVEIVSFDILLCMSLELQEGPLRIRKDIMLFQYNLKHSSSVVYHRSCLSVDLLHWYDNGDWC